MKIIALALALVAGCAAHRPPPQRNLAAAFVHQVDADIPCVEYFTDVGEHHAHAAVCKTPAKTLLYCTIADDRWPACKPIDGSDAKPAPAAAPSSPPAPPSPSEPPPVAPPAKGKK